MNSRWVVAFLAFFLGLIMGISLPGKGFSAEPEIFKGESVINIKSAGHKGKKALKLFPHQSHQESFICDECHHGLGYDGKPVCSDDLNIQRCDVCHNGVVKNKKLDTPKKAFHVNCKGCHKAEAKKEGSKVKGSCKECHAKKERPKNIEGC